MQSTLRLQTLPFSSARTYMMAALFIVGNVVLPQLFHFVPQGGITWLPIYFFTLIGAYKYGWKAGVMTAIASPLVNSWLFGMPAVAILPVILMKSLLLAAIAGYAAAYFRKASLWMLMAVVLGYQLLGTLGEWALSGNLMLACQDFRIGIPGMLLQIVGGWLIINFIIRK
ncbi:MAG: ECF transporter S component [Muribaculaceae bacterium]|nr:ECF transporter S component [Muribaculaceae bacterium]